MELLMRFGYIGLIAFNSIVIAIIAMFVLLFMKRVQARAKSLVPKACIVAVLIIIGLSCLLTRRFALISTLNNVLSGFVAYGILRILFRREISGIQGENQELTEGENEADLNNF
jgi:hypothetical protein